MLNSPHETANTDKLPAMMGWRRFGKMTSVRRCQRFAPSPLADNSNSQKSKLRSAARLEVSLNHISTKVWITIAARGTRRLL